MRAIARAFAAGVMIMAIVSGARSASALPKDSKPDPVAELKSTIRSSVALLKEKKWEEFLELLTPPNEFEQQKKNGHIREIIDGMNREPDKVDILVKIFEKLIEQEPKLNEESTRATFSAPAVEGAPPVKEWKFSKLKGHWYAERQRRPAANQ